MIQFIDALAFFFLIGMSIIGFRRGLVEELGRLLGLIFATVFSLKFYVKLGSMILNWISMDVWVLFILSFIAIFSIVAPPCPGGTNPISSVGSRSPTIERTSSGVGGMIGMVTRKT